MGTATAFTTLYSASGSATSHPNTVNSVALTGMVEQSIPPDNTVNPSQNNYWNNQAGTALTTNLVAQPFGFASRTICLFNDDGAKSISWSFDGTDIEGTLNAGDDIVMDGTQHPGIFLKSSSAGASYRIIVW